MNIEDTIETLWKFMQAGPPYPDTLAGRLTLEDGYRVQLGILDRHLAGGAAQAGWKIGLSADAVRKNLGADAPAFGYLLADRRYDDAAVFPHDGIFNPGIEAELAITLGKTLRGPGITRDEVLDAVASVAPALEIVSFRANLAGDLPLAVADNVVQWAYVTAGEIRPYPRELDLEELRFEIDRNGKRFAEGRGANVIDHQLDSIAWLANELSKHDRALEAGQLIMSGSFIKPTPVDKGDRWEARFPAIGSVRANFS